jgi:peptidoglycan-associated lipoprotein
MLDYSKNYSTVEGRKIMNMTIRFMYTLMILCTVLFSLGCAKQALEPVVTTEIAKPQPQTQTETAKEQTDMKMGTPEAGQGTGMTTGKGALEQARVAFENTDIFFEYDSFDLTTEAKKILAEKAGFLNSHSTIKVRIEGNCDERGTEEYNLALGERRAKAAQDYLVFLGIASERLTTVSYGEEKPFDGGHNEAAWAKNRRTHFAILGE